MKQQLTLDQHNDLSEYLGFVQGVLSLIFLAIQPPVDLNDIKGLGWVISEAESRL